jgi:hypothetical protein
MNDRMSLPNKGRPRHRRRLADDRFGSIATKLAGQCHVRYFPDSDRNADITGGPVRAIFCREQMQQMASLLDHLVGERQQRRRNVDAERLRGLEVENQIASNVPHAASTTRCSSLPKRRKRGPPNIARTGRKPNNHRPKLKLRHPVARLNAGACGDGHLQVGHAYGRVDRLGNPHRARLRKTATDWARFRRCREGEREERRRPAASNSTTSQHAVCWASWPCRGD